MPESNLGKWAPWYDQLAPGAEPQPYGATPTYQIGAHWLRDCFNIQDWGCGKGWFKTVLEPGRHRYVGIDGTTSPFADLVADLADEPVCRYLRTSALRPDGIFMRGVLEHVYRWRQIVSNAMESFIRRMVLVLFTPMSSGTTRELNFIHELGVPDLSIGHRELEEVILEKDPELFIAWRDIESPDTGYGVERIYYLEK